MIGVPWFSQRFRGFCLALAVSGSLAGCASQQSAPAPVPIVVAPEQNIPPDLDIVFYVDLSRLRDGLVGSLYDVFQNALLERYRLGDFAAEFDQAQRMWLGLRPGESATSVASDYVFVLDGRFVTSDPRAWSGDFFSARDLGNAYLRFDAKDTSLRSAPGRIYVQGGTRIIVASSAEVDAVERVVERNHHARTMVPNAQGTVSWAINLSNLPEHIARHSPKAAALLERATATRGSLLVDQEALAVQARLSFQSPGEARRASAALGLVSETLGLRDEGGVALEHSAVESDLTVSMRIDLARALHWLGLSSKAVPKAHSP